MFFSQALVRVAGLGTGLVTVLAIVGFMSNMLKKSVSGPTVCAGAVTAALAAGGGARAATVCVGVQEEFSSAETSFWEWPGREVVEVLGADGFAAFGLGASVNLLLSHSPRSYLARMYFSIVSTPAFLLGFGTRFPPFPPKYRRAALLLPMTFMTLISSRCQW